MSDKGERTYLNPAYACLKAVGPLQKRTLADTLRQATLSILAIRVPST